MLDGLAPCLRPAQAADAPALAQLLLDSRRAFLPYAPSPHADDDVRRWMREVLLPGGGVTVVECDGDLQGLLAVQRESTAGVAIGWISQMYMAPGAVGQGLGGALLQQVLATLPSPQRLHCFQANTGARRFYERAGFVPLALGDGRGAGSSNEEGCPDVLYERWASPGPRVRLRRLQPSDLDDFCAYRGDSDVGRYQGWSPMPPAQALAFLVLMHRAPPLVTGEWLQLGIARHDVADPGPCGDRLIGDIGLLRHDEASVEIGFTLQSASQRQGLASEVLRLVLGWLWTLPELQRVRATTDARNTASARLLQRLGFLQVAERETLFRDEPCVELDYVLQRAW